MGRLERACRGVGCEKEGRIGNNVSVKGRRERVEEETQHLQGGGEAEQANAAAGV